MTVNRLLLSITILLAFVLSGCAARSIDKDFAFDPGKDEGIVIVSVSHDVSGGRATRGFFNVNGGPIEKNGLLLASLIDVAPGIAGSNDFKGGYGKLYVLPLPAGKHVISSWRVAYGSTLSVEPRVLPTPLEFVVTAGEVKYLGNLHANLQTGKGIFGQTVLGDAYPEVRDQRARDIALFAARYPRLKDGVVVGLLATGPWLSSPENTRQVNLPPPVPIPTK